MRNKAVELVRQTSRESGSFAVMVTDKNSMPIAMTVAFFALVIHFKANSTRLQQHGCVRQVHRPDQQRRSQIGGIIIEICVCLM